MAPVTDEKLDRFGRKGHFSLNHNKLAFHPGPPSAIGSLSTTLRRRYCEYNYKYLYALRSFAWRPEQVLKGCLIGSRWLCLLVTLSCCAKKTFLVLRLRGANCD